MAHLANYKIKSVSAMVEHYERVAEIERGYKRDNIDNNRTYLNYNLRPHNVKDEVKQAIKIHEDTSKKSIRKDANVFSDWVVTLPKDCKDYNQRQFFEVVTQFIEDRYGIDNVVGAYVHLDEATPHIHIPVLPVIDGRMSAAKIFNRADLRSFHSELSKFVDDCLGYHVSIELDERQCGDKQLSSLNQKDYIAAKQELEYLRQKIEEVQPTSQTFAESCNRFREIQREKAAIQKEFKSEIRGFKNQIRKQETEIERVDSYIEEERGNIKGQETEIERVDSYIEEERGNIKGQETEIERVDRENERITERMRLLTEQHAELRLECEQSRKRFEQVRGKFIEVVKSIQSIPVNLFDSFSKLAKQIIQDAELKITKEKETNNSIERSETRSKTEMLQNRPKSLRERGESARAVSNSLESNLTHNSRTSRGYER